MKIICEKNDLIRSVNIVSKAVAVKSPVNILEGILLIAQDDRLMLYGSDGTLSIKCSNEASILEKGEIVLPARLFGEILSKFDDCELSIHTEESSAIMQCGHSVTTLRCMNSESYPDFPAYSKENAVKMSSNQIISMIEQTVFATSVSEDKPILTGILLEIEEGSARMVALDGYRLAIRHENIQSGVRSQDVVVPSKSMREVAHILPDDEQDVMLYMEENLVSIVCGDMEIATRVLQGDYVKYKNILPAEHMTRVTVSTQSILGSLERASILARQSKSNLVNFKMEEENIIITSDSEMGKAKEEVEITLTGKNIDISFNSRYLLDVFKEIYDEKVILDFNTSISPCMIRPVEGESYLYLVLPVKTSNS